MDNLLPVSVLNINLKIGPVQVQADATREWHLYSSDALNGSDTPELWMPLEYCLRNSF